MDRCPSCSAELPADSVVPALMAARCAKCGVLVDLKGRGVVRFQPVEKPALTAQPEGWNVEELGGRFTVRWRWFTGASLMMIPFTLFWNGILVVMGGAVSDGFTHPERLLYGLAVPHVWVGIGLAYGVLMSFFNSTVVAVETGELTVKSGPLPWFGNRRIAVGEIEQLFVVERRGRGTRYEVCVLMKDGKKKTLLGGLTSEDKARFLEARLESLLGIVDRPVAGELRR